MWLGKQREISFAQQIRSAARYKLSGCVQACACVWALMSVVMSMRLWDLAAAYVLAYKWLCVCVCVCVLMKGSIRWFLFFVLFCFGVFFSHILPLLVVFLFVSGLVTMSGGESSAVPIQHHSSHMSNSQSRCWGTKISISSVPSSPLSAALSHPLSLCISARAPSLINGCGSWRLGWYGEGAKEKKKRVQRRTLWDLGTGRSSTILLRVTSFWCRGTGDTRTRHRWMRPL